MHNLMIITFSVIILFPINETHNVVFDYHVQFLFIFLKATLLDYFYYFLFYTNEHCI